MSSPVMMADHPDRVRKLLSCLGCGKAMWTDRCHRICRKCQRRNDAAAARRPYHATPPRGACLEETPAARTFFDW